MPVNKIIERIEKDVNRKVQNLLDREQEKAEEERKKIEQEKERRLNDIRKKKEREIKTMKNRIISQAKLERQKKKLKVREEMMDKVFDKAKQELKDADPSEYEDYLRQAIGKSSRVLGNDTVIHCNIDSVDKVEELAGKIDSSLEVEGDIKTIGGIKAENAQGARIDLTFEANIERKKKEIRKEISDILFSEEE